MMTIIMITMATTTTIILNEVVNCYCFGYQNEVNHSLRMYVVYCWPNYIILTWSKVVS